jgi:hypothetical protein
MNPSFVETIFDMSPKPNSSRLDYLDATRAFALVLGIVFHSCLSFMPVFVGWAVQDISTSPLVGIFMTVSHSFRMEAFFLLAGFFSYLTYHRKGAREFVRARVLRILVPFVVGQPARKSRYLGRAIGRISNALHAAGWDFRGVTPLVPILSGADHGAVLRRARIAQMHRFLAKHNDSSG